MTDLLARQIDLWSTSSARKHSGQIELLKPIAQELARKARHHGVTIADVRIIAIQRGLLSGAESGRDLSYLGAVMRAAKLSATDRTRRSHIDKSHGNRHTVWIDPGACA